MDTFVGIMRNIESTLQIETMTLEYEIVACFFDHPALTPHELFALSRSSHSAFSNILRRLEDRQIIYSQTHPTDKRSRIYQPSPKMAEIITQETKEIRLKTFEEWQATKGNAHFLKIYRSNIRRTVGIRNLTCEYQVLLNLYFNSGISNMEFANLVDTSPTTLNRSLRALSEAGLIHAEKDHQDKRIKRYAINNLAKEAIEASYQRLYSWVREKWLLDHKANTAA